MAVTEGAASGKLSEQQHGIYMQGQAMTRLISRWLLGNASSTIKNKNGVQSGSIPIVRTSTSGIPRNRRRQPRPAPTSYDSNKDNTDHRAKSALKPSLYLPFANDISQQQPKIQVPSHILDALRHSIRFRLVCCSWFTNSQDPSIVRSNLSHMAFVRILERTLNILEPLLASVPVDKSVESDVQCDTITVANMFESLKDYDDHLEIDAETEKHGGDEDQSDNGPVATDVLAAGDSISKDSVAVYRRICATRCLLRDVGRVQGFITQQWAAYVAGETRLIEAAMLTNLGISQVRMLEKDFRESLGIPLNEPADAIYPELLLPTASENPDSVPTLERSVASNIIISSADFDLVRSWPLAQALVDMLRMRTGKSNISKSVLDRLLEIQDNIEFVHICCDHGCGDSRHLADGQGREIVGPAREAVADLHGYRHGLMLVGFHEPSPSSPAFSYDESVLEEYVAIFADNFSRCDSHHSCHTCAEDGVLTELRMAVVEGDASLTTTFAIAVFGAIRSVVGPHHSCFKEVQRAAREVIDDTSISDARFSRIIGTCRCKHGHVENANALSRFAQNVLYNKEKVGGPRADQFRDHELAVQKNIVQYSQHNPLACGTICWELQYRNYCEKLHAVDSRGTIRAFLHFYNIPLQRGELSGQWRDMEYLIDKYTKKKIFLDSERPESLEQAISVYRIVFKLSFDLGMVFTGRGVVTSDWDNKKGVFWYVNNTPFCELLRRLLFGLSEIQQFVIPPSDVELVLKLAQQGYPVTPRIGATTKRDFKGNIGLENRDAVRKALVRIPPYTILQQLEAAQHALAAEWTEITDDFDILRLEGLCWDLLTKIRSRFISEDWLGESKGFEGMEHFMKIPNSGLESEEHRYLGRPLLWLAFGTDGKFKDLIKKCPRKNCQLCKAWLSLRPDKLPYPYKRTVKMLQEFIDLHGYEVSVTSGKLAPGSDNGMANKLWVAVGNAKMLTLRELEMGKHRIGHAH